MKTANAFTVGDGVYTPAPMSEPEPQTEPGGGSGAKPPAPGKKLLIDFGPLLVFFAVYVQKDIFWATGAFMVLSIATLGYSWGDKSLAFHTCRTCGCTTHWEPLDPSPQSRMAVNCRMSDPAAIAGLRIRNFDGADSWKYLD